MIEIIKDIKSISIEIFPMIFFKLLKKRAFNKEEIKGMKNIIKIYIKAFSIL
tara:strand:+ start:648 stop:803 length:156 start_codon:yes stop_codon:yes gene_type:complete